jgi:predicted RecB family nuclease
MKTIANAFDLGLKANRKERPASTFFRGSKLGSCLRQQYYDATGEPVTNPFEDRLYRIFEQGHVIANTFERNLRDSGLFDEFMSEVPVEIDKYNFSGNIDHLVQWKNRDHIENGWEVIEMKSMNSNGFKYLKGPKPEHAIQAASYALALEYNGFLPEEIYDQQIQARVVYVSKDDFNISEYTIGREWYDRAERVLKIGNKFREQGRIPFRLPVPEGKDPKKMWPCAGCQWLTKCRGGE